MSDLIWYVHRNGKSLGPYSLGDLKEQVSQGILLGHDLVFREGESEWRRAFDWTELAKEIYSEERTSFTRLFQLPKFDSIETQDWIALVRYEENKVMRFEQVGPYSTEKVRELLSLKTLKPSDHIWKKGYAAWVPIYLEPDFSASLWNVKNESIPLLEQVHEMPKPELPEVEVEYPAAEMTKPVLVAPVVSLAKPAVPPVVNKDQVRAKALIQKKPNFQLAAFSIISLVVISSLALLYYSKKNHTFSGAQSSHLQINAVNNPPPADLVNETPESAGVEGVSTSSVALSRSQELTEENLDLPASAENESPQASEVESSTAKNHEPVPAGFWSFRLNTKSKLSPLLIISGGSGRILNLPALNIRINGATLSSDGLVTFDPKAHKLPQGYYRIMIYQGADVVYQEEKAYIENLALFQKQIAVHRKQIAFLQQQEKRKLLKTIDRTQQFVSRYKNVLSGRSAGLKDRVNVQNEYESLQVSELKAARGTKNQLMYSSGWYGLAQQVESLRSAVGSVGGRKPASRLDFDQVRKKMVVLRSQISQTSLASEQ